MSSLIDNPYIVTGGTVALVSIAAVIFVARRVPNKSKKAVTATILASAVLCAVSVLLTHLLATKRDRYNRQQSQNQQHENELRNLQDKHYSQLRPVQRADGKVLNSMVKQIETPGHLTTLDQK